MATEEPPGDAPEKPDAADAGQDWQENSIPVQRDQVREWAEERGVEIVQESADPREVG